MTFHVTALEAAQLVFDGKLFKDTNAYSVGCDELQAALQQTDVFATVQMSHDPHHGTFTVMIDRAPQSAEGFEGQDERLYVTYKMDGDKPLKYYGSRAEQCLIKIGGGLLKKPWRRYYYHASHYDIDWPCEASNAKAKARPACASLFANSNRAVSHYGGNLYRFKLRGSTPVLSVSEGDYYSYRHNASFRAELFSQAKRDGFKAIICPISRQDISVVVLDFTAFKSWERVCG